MPKRMRELRNIYAPSQILLLCGANGVGKDEPPDVTDTPGVGTQ